MIELGADNAAAYLAGRGLADSWRVTELGGGVSNTVLLMESETCRLVLKQALGKLRVEQDWFSDRGRIFRESSALGIIASWLPAGSVPEILFEDRENLLFAMSAAPTDAPNWKSLLLAGTVDPAVAARIGEMLAAMIRHSWGSAECQAAFGDQTVFDQLRLDPYYRSTARRHPDLSAHFHALIDESGQRRVSLVHGDWSPKNFLVWADRVMAIDFEVIHYGDPAFDTGFMLNHLVLKSFYRPERKAEYRRAAETFWGACLAGLPAEAQWMEPATIRHLGCLMLARIDGKSPAEYLQDEGLRERIRQFARGLMADPPDTVQEVFQCL